MLIRTLLTLGYTLIGCILAFPLSYWFQSEIYHEMSWIDYLRSGTEALKIGAQFGAIEVLTYTAMVCIIAMIIIGRGVELWLNRKQHSFK